MAIAGLGIVVIDAPHAAAVNQACVGAKRAEGKAQTEAEAACADSATAKQELQNGLTGFIKNIINILLFIIGAIAVIMIIIGGIRYVVSNGDSSQTTAAKNTILYAVVGLVIAMMAYAIVNWVIGSL